MTLPPTRERHAHHPPAHGTGAAPKVSVVVPARNEAACLAACLASLVEQEGVEAEIIVVDDHSTDATAALAGSFAGVQVLAADPLADGWCGKQNALATGARYAGGEWLLFTDADTVHLPGSLARALQEAEQHQAALLSYSPAQEMRTLWELAVLPLVFAELAGTYRPRDVCDPNSPVAAANGQYLLIRRDAYDAVGGHATVRASLLEDVELARLVKRSGRRLRFRFGGDAVRTRMYRTFRELCEGWTKNLALLFPHAGGLALQRALEFALITGGSAAFVAALAHRSTVGAIIAGTLATGTYGMFLRRIRRAHAGAKAEAVALFGLPLFVYLLARSAIRYHTGRAVQWKGREYTANRVIAKLSD